LTVKYSKSIFALIMGGTGGDGTLQGTGGPIEGRAGRAPVVDPQTAARLETQRQQEAVGAVLDDFQTTFLDPIAANFPNLVIKNNPFAFTDKSGFEWKITPRTITQDGKLESAGMVGVMEQTHSSGRTILTNPRIYIDRTSSEPVTALYYGARPGKSDVEFVKDKIAELLDPIKAAQAANPPIPDYPAKAYRHPEGHIVMEVPGTPSFEHGETTYTPIEPANGGLGYWDDHP
jgi:hypothetical protein